MYRFDFKLLDHLKYFYYSDLALNILMCNTALRFSKYILPHNCIQIAKTYFNPKMVTIIAKETQILNNR